MDIKIGFVDSPRELVINTDRSQDEVAAQVSDALGADNGVLWIDDSKGNKYALRNRSIAYVELGSSNARPVGFMN